MRVAVRLHDLGIGSRGGVETHAREFLKGLSAAGGRLDVTVLLEPGAPGASADAAGLRVRRLSSPPPRRWRTGLAALASIRGGRPLASARSREIDELAFDLVHYPGTRMTELELQTPTVLTFFDMQEEFLPTFFPLRERLARRLLNRAGALRASRVIAASDFTALALVERWRVPETRLERVPTPVGDRFRPEPEPGERERLESRYSLPPGDFALYPANAWPHKNHARLLAALAGLEAEGTGLRLVCTGALRGGSGDRRGLGGGPRAVVDIGFVRDEDVPALYRAARLLLFPSLFEGFGLPVLEALASGCPVACSRIPPLVELAEGAAHFFDPLDVASISRTAREAWADADLRRSLVAEGLERARAYRWDVVLPALVEVYRKAKSGGRS